MLLQQLVVLLALACTALAVGAHDAADVANDYTTTVRNDVYSTEYTTVTATGEPPLTPPVNSPVTMVYTSAVSTLGLPKAPGNPGYSYANSTTPAATSASFNTTVSTVPSPSGPVPPTETGAASAPASFLPARLLVLAVLALSCAAQL